MQYTLVEHELTTGENMSEVDEKAKEMQSEDTVTAEPEDLVSAMDEKTIAVADSEGFDVTVEADTAANEVAVGSEEAPASVSEQEDADATVPQKKAKGVGDLVIVGIFSLILGVLLCLPTIMGSMGSTSTQGYDLSGGVAASFGDVKIGENDITEYIENLRTYQNLTDEKAWGEWLASQGQSPESIRSGVISYFVEQALITKAAEDMGVEVTEEQVDEQVEAIAEMYGGMDAFEEMILSSGSTMEEVRDSVNLSLKQQALAGKVASEEMAIDDETVLAVLKLYYPDEVPEDATTLEGLDPEMVDYVRSSLQDSMRDQAFSDWFEQYWADADVKISDMPEGLPYAIDMSAYGSGDELVELIDDAEAVQENQEEEPEAGVAD